MLRFLGDTFWQRGKELESLQVLLTLWSLQRARISVGPDCLRANVEMIPERLASEVWTQCSARFKIFRISGELDSKLTC